jgi:hypothetical protein
LTMHASRAYNAGMQYTLRNVPRHLDRILRAKARAESKSINTVALEALQQGLGVNGASKQYDDLDWFFGSGKLERKVTQAIADHDVIHRDDWR